MASVSEARAVSGSLSGAQALTGVVAGARTITGTANVVASASVACDDELDENSTAPVQNKVVTAALASKVAKDDAMTSEQVKSLFHD